MRTGGRLNPRALCQLIQLALVANPFPGNHRDTHLKVPEILEGSSFDPATRSPRKLARVSVQFEVSELVQGTRCIAAMHHHHIRTSPRCDKVNRLYLTKVFKRLSYLCLSDCLCKVSDPNGAAANCDMVVFRRRNSFPLSVPLLGGEGRGVPPARGGAVGGRGPRARAASSWRRRGTGPVVLMVAGWRPSFSLSVSPRRAVAKV